jgi:predicted GNAT superfamily acetyltransferase
LLVNRRIHLRLAARRLLVEIPSSTDTMRASDMKLAARWRTETRRIFQLYFRDGYRVADFVPPSEATAGKCFYVLRRIGDGT